MLKSNAETPFYRWYIMVYNCTLTSVYFKVKIRYNWKEGLGVEGDQVPI